ncbi:peptidase M14 carboxypeptidase A [Pirellula staleyi DSM 6068]|uniref:Peptidase M14 carboxypeptidase A n=1 Tax=Pirellula staleyi (strain ATCC 27377 / DSM 6068 / ICPB 4128) TaxID=530564 RepID=D2R0X4_PIRSD|nr:peptidase M14 carboxypeptidase A [Pirellula staleyi DSM 6068]
MSSSSTIAYQAFSFRYRTLQNVNTMKFVSCLLATIVLLTSIAAATAADPKGYITAGAPSNPKVKAIWNKYHDYAESTRMMRDLAAAYPEFAKLESAGKTVGDREMWVLTVTNFAKGDASSRPGMWIDGAIHANEIQATEVVLYTAWYLLESRASNEVIEKLLDERVFFLMPMMSPDSRDAHFYEPNTTHSPRTGQRPKDDDGDGRVDEDGPDDLDGDGSITLMRVRDPRGNLKSDPEIPGRMIPVKPGEKGEFRIIGQEGLDDDGDGEVNEDGDGFYDPNRDWAWNWQPNHIQNGAHRYPYSILENRHIAEFITKYPNIVGGQSYHNAGGMILRGPGAKTDNFEPADIRIYDQLAERGGKVLPGYRYINIANDLYEVYGGEIDWLHQVRGLFVFSNELFTPFNFFRTTGHEGFFGSSETQHLFDKYLLLSEGFSPWKEIDHPQFGKVEVGGMRKNWLRQPPSFLLEEECHRNMAFTLYHADELPLVSITEVAMVDLGGGVKQITAVIENPKICPTHSAIDVRRKITRPDLVSLVGDKLEVHSALIADEPLFTSPREQERKPAEVKLDRIDGRGGVYVRWIISGGENLEVKVSSVKGGSDSKKVNP